MIDTVWQDVACEAILFFVYLSVLNYYSKHDEAPNTRSG
jgi:hypothetical protein